MNFNPTPKKVFLKINPARIAILYFIVSSLWIFFSDRVVELLITDLDTLSIIQSIKGFLFVIITTVLIFFLINKYVTLLISQNTLLEDILETIPVGIILTDQVGQITFANNEAEKVLGLKKSKITSRNYNAPEWKITRVDGLPLPDEELPFVKVKNTLKPVQDIQHTIEYSNGEKKILSVNAAPRFKKNKFDGIIASIQDITDKKLTEQSLLEKNKFISAVTNTVPAIIYIYDLESHTNVYSNQGIERILGYTPDEIKQMGPELFSNLIHPEDLEEVIAFQSKIFNAADNEKLTIEYRMKHKNGNWINLHSIEMPFVRGNNGKLIQKIGIAIDISDIRKAEKDLLNSEIKFSKIFHSSPVALLITRFDDGCFIDVNDTYCKLVGYSKSELIGRRTTDLNIYLDPKDRQTIIEQLIEKKSLHNYETVIKDKFGNLKHVLASLELIIIDEKKYILTSILDITERKQAEAELKSSEEQLRLSTELANVAVWEYNFITNNMTRSKNHDKLYGLEWQENWQFETFLNATHPDDRQYSNEIIQKSVSPGGPDFYKFDFRIVTPENTIRWLEVTGQVVERNENGQGIIVRGTLIDITERKLTEIALKESEEKFFNAFHTSPVGITINRISDGKFIEVNDSFLKIFEYTREEVIGHTSLELNMMSKEERDRIIKWQIETGGLQNFELAFHTKSGKIIHSLFSSRPMMFEGEKCHVTTIIDISDKKKAEEELRISSEKLRELTHYLQTVREEEREAIARDIHDDFGQVLTSLKMNLAFLKRSLINLEIIQHNPELEKEFDSMSKIIDNSVIKLRRLITNLRPEVLDKLGLIPALEWLVKEFQNNYHIESSFESTTEELVLDKTTQITFFRILQEALNNIAKHSNATNVKTAFIEDVSNYRLEITDNGIGFNKNAQRKNRFGIIGMQERANLIGGTFTIDSEPGKGTKVIFCVPKQKSGCS